MSTLERTLRRQPMALPGVLLALLAVAALVSATRGGVPIPAADVALFFGHILGLGEDGTPDARTVTVLSAIRLPRLALGIVAGAVLGLSGAALQALFRNPLADAGLIGVSTGASLAVALSILGGAAVLPGIAADLRPVQLPVAGFLGGLVATVIVYRLASGPEGVGVATLLLAGVAINAIGMAGLGFITYLSDDSQLRQITFWLLGSLSGVTPAAMIPAVAVMAGAGVALLLLARPLNLLLLGEAEAYHLGLSVDRFKPRVVVLVALGVGASVAVTGPVGFIGLVAAHLVRLMAGPDHRIVLPGAACMGALLLTLGDLAARTVVLPAELPVGVMTAAIGGPFFLALLLRARRHGGIA